MVNILCSSSFAGGGGGGLFVVYNNPSKFQCLTLTYDNSNKSRCLTSTWNNVQRLTLTQLNFCNRQHLLLTRSHSNNAQRFWHWPNLIPVTLSNWCSPEIIPVMLGVWCWPKNKYCDALWLLRSTWPTCPWSIWAWRGTRLSVECPPFPCSTTCWRHISATGAPRARSWVWCSKASTLRQSSTSSTLMGTSRALSRSWSHTLIGGWVAHLGLHFGVDGWVPHFIRWVGAAL